MTYGDFVGAFSIPIKSRGQRYSEQQDEPAKDARGIVRECIKNKYFVAVATANNRTDKLRKVLPRIEPEVFNEVFLDDDNELFQHSHHNKSVSLRNILKATEASPQCALFFDDGIWNKKYADEVRLMTWLIFKLTDTDIR